MASPTHKVDCYKNRVALEIEWNNKDPFFDRDLNNFRLLFDLRAISIGVIVTRCDELQLIFNDLGRGASYGASTTHKRLSRYGTMTTQEIMELPVAQLALPKSHLYLWVPNALILEGLEVMRRWGFTYKTNLVWYKVRKDGGPDGRGVGFYFRNVTELILFGIRGTGNRTLAAGRRQVNIISTRKREHSRKPDELYSIIESCSRGPYLELFARHPKVGWTQWGNEIDRSQQLPLKLVASAG